MDQKQLQECHERIKPFIHNTPVLTSRLIDQMVGASVFFKCENFQRMGAFKMRGAANAIMQLPKALQQKGVVTHSSGNFAQALSLAAQSLGVKAFIVMPKNAPQVKKNAVKGYGGIVVECESTLKAREKEAQKIEEEQGATFIHPSNDDAVILGQGTACKELLEEHSELDYVFAPVGGGGLIAGTALAAHYFGNSCKVIGGEPLEADDAYRSLKSGTIETNISTNTVADGLRTHLGDINFPIVQRYVDHITRVTEDEIVAAMQILWERLKIVCEPSSAVAFAATLKEKELLKGKKIGIIISGGNVDVNRLPFSGMNS
jgi:threonine dehydratase